MITILSNRDIYESVIYGIMPQVKERLRIPMADIKEVCGTYVARFMRYGGQARRAEDGVLLEVLARKARRVGGLRVGLRAIIPTRMFRSWIAMCAWAAGEGATLG